MGFFDFLAVILAMIFSFIVLAMILRHLKEKESDEF